MQRPFRILRRREVFNRFIFRIEELTVEYERFDGSLSGEVTRLVLERGDSVAILLHDTVEDTVILCEQFRAPASENGPGWLLELPAGMLEKEESAENCARRESLEETGYEVEQLRPIANVYLSPGGSSERIHIFYAEVSSASHISAGGGVPEEQEDIRLINLSLEDALAMACGGSIFDAKTVIALQWLQVRKLQGTVGGQKA